MNKTTENNGRSDGPTLEEVNVVVSDFHLADGVFTGRVVRSQGLETVVQDVPNALEDFYDDQLFADFLDELLRVYTNAPVIRLRLMGDVFDPLVVPWKGKHTDPPFEAVAVHKMRKIIEGHSVFFAALAKAISDPRCVLDIFVGNHDAFLVWEKVQEVIRERLLRNNTVSAFKIRFIDQRNDFEDVDRDVCYYHGMNADAFNTMNPADIILTERFGKPLPRPMLNAPLASYMVVGLANRLKRRNPHIGRIHGRIVWKQAAIRKWGWSLYALIMSLRYVVYHIYMVLWLSPQQANLWKQPWTTLVAIYKTVVNMIRVIGETFTDDATGRVDRLAERMLQERPGIRVVVLGHSHGWRRISTQLGTYLNCGSWALTYRAVEPQPNLHWRRFRWLQFLSWTFVHYFKTGELQLTRRILKLVGVVALAVAAVVFMCVNFSGNSWEILSLAPNDFKLPVAIFSSFFVALSCLRIVAVPPVFEECTRRTFARIEHYNDGSMSADVLECIRTDTGDVSLRECV